MKIEAGLTIARDESGEQVGYECTGCGETIEHGEESILLQDAVVDADDGPQVHQYAGIYHQRPDCLKEA